MCQKKNEESRDYLPSVDRNNTAPIHRALYTETIRAYSRDLPEDQGEEVIDYFYRKANLP